MKKELHPDYHPVVFEDVSAGHRFLSKSTVKSDETIEWEDGNTYPLVKVEVSSASHPFYTGEKIFIDTAGRVDKFKKRYTTVVGAKRKTRRQPKRKASLKESAAADDAPKPEKKDNKKN